jgi:hypothetical protein
MSDEPSIRRVVIVCDTASDIRVAVTDAAVLAARWRIPLHGVFLDDVNLRRLAQLPFGRHVSLSSTEMSESVGDLAALSSVVGAGMRRALEQAALEHGLEWSFGAVRDFHSSGALPTVEGDMVLLEMHARSFSGAWGPRSRWEACFSGCTCTTLVRGRRKGGSGVVTVLSGDAAFDRKVLAAAAAMAEEADALIALVPADRSDEAAASLAAEWRGRRVRIEPIEDGADVLAKRLAVLQPALVVIHAETLSSEAVGALALDGHCDLLLVQ